MFDDLLDFLFTVMAAFFLLIFINVIFSANQDNNNKITEGKVAHFEEINAVHNKVQFDFVLGKEINLKSLPYLLNEGYFFEGRAVYGCNDYLNEMDCNADKVEFWRIKQGYKCSWSLGAKKCESVANPATRKLENK